MKRWLVIIVLTVACKERGTIAIEFSDTCAAPGDRSVVYAEPNLSCDACLCGGCFGAKPDDVIASDSDADLDLSPGHWAVVLARFDDHATEVAQGCVEIDVDEDGTASRPATGTVACVDSCP